MVKTVSLIKLNLNVWERASKSQFGSMCQCPAWCCFSSSPGLQVLLWQDCEWHHLQEVWARPKPWTLVLSAERWGLSSVAYYLPSPMDWLLVLDVTLAFWRISCSCLHFGKHTVFNWCMVIVPQRDISVYVTCTVQTRAVVITITLNTHHISPWGVSRVVSPGYFEMLSTVFILPCCRDVYVLPRVHLHPCTC